MPNLYDILTRHQIYLEGVKQKQANEFSNVLLDIAKELRLLFSTLEYDTLDGLTQKKLNEFIASLKKTQQKIYSKYSSDLYVFLHDFVEADKDVTIYAFEETQDEDVLTPILAAAGKALAIDLLLSRALSAPLPANGILTKPFISSFIGTAIDSVINKTRQGYANKWTKQQTLNAIIGTKATNYRDGVLHRLNSQASAVLATVVQHVSITVQAAIEKEYFTYYQWVSTIDDKTTDICISRNGNVYEYDEGPLPPAHIRCRSKIIPVLVQDDKAPDKMPTSKTYLQWLKEQPPEVQDDILGEDKAKALRAGKYTVKDMPRFEGAKPLTLAQFRAKRTLMTTD